MAAGYLIPQTNPQTIADGIFFSLSHSLVMSSFLSYSNVEVECVI
jgi:hypothetical protein